MSLCRSSVFVILTLSILRRFSHFYYFPFFVHLRLFRPRERNRTFLHLTNLTKVRTGRVRPVSTPTKTEAGPTASKVRFTLHHYAPLSTVLLLRCNSEMSGITRPFHGLGVWKIRFLFYSNILSVFVNTLF